MAYENLTLTFRLYLVHAYFYDMLNFDGSRVWNDDRINSGQGC